MTQLSKTKTDHTWT